jgi:predicted Holliday junction resolvase-like endonuclease
MTTLIYILAILLLIVMIVHVSIEIYAYIINRKSDVAFIKLQETFNNVQQDFANEKANFRKITESKNEEIKILADEIKRLKFELIKSGNNQ